MTHRFPKLHLIAASIIGIALTFILVLSPSGQVNATRTSIPIEVELSQPSLLETIKLSEHQAPSLSKPLQTSTKQSKAVPAQHENWQTYTVKNGHSLSSIFALAGLNDKTMYSVLGNKKQNKSLSKIYPGEQISFLFSTNNKLSKIKLIRSPLTSIFYTRTDSGIFINETINRKPDIHIAYSEGEIQSSLFLAGQAAELSQKQIMELANIFGWDIDFILDIRRGDKFSLIYEELYLDGEKYKNGKILAAKFSNQNRELEAVLYTDKNGFSNYFTPDGKSMRKAFIRTPVDFARISSRFNLRRKHPVLHKIRAHKGTDYAAARGTPIKATGDGKVIHASRKGGYGKAVIIQHGQKFTTLYAHMSKYAKGVRVGKRVKQGQVIGYIGSTGLASGPHLHYEFRVNGVHKNSLKVKLPQAMPIPRKQLADFQQQTHLYLAQLSTFSDSYQLAANP